MRKTWGNDAGHRANPSPGGRCEGSAPDKKRLIQDRKNIGQASRCSPSVIYFLFRNTHYFVHEGIDADPFTVCLYYNCLVSPFFCIVPFRIVIPNCLSLLGLICRPY